MKLLFLSRWYPYPPTNGSKLRIQGMLDFLGQRHQVDLISFAEPEEEVSAKPKGGCVSIQVVRRRPFDPHSVRARMGYFRLQPRSVIATYSSEMENLIRSALENGKYSAIIASQIDMAIYSRRFGGVPALLEEIELSVLHEQYRNAETSLVRARNGLTWLKHRRYVNTILEDFSACTVASMKERDLLACIVGESLPIEVVPNSLDVDSYQGVVARRRPATLIFTGSLSFGPNYDAMLWFVDQVFPAIRKEVPDVQLLITGDHAGKRLPSLEAITLTGMVDDVRPVIASSTVSLAPILTGGGSRLKILEAMALKTPVVATTKGAEGLDVVGGEHLLIADTPDEFRRAVVNLLRSDAQRRELSENAYALVRERYDSKVVFQRLSALLEEVAASDGRRR